MKKAFSILRTSLVWLVAVLAIFMMIFTIISVTTFDRNDRSLFGYRAYIVLSDSMSESELNKDLDTHFGAGALIFVKDVDCSTLQPGDIITYISQNSENDSFGKNITHMIRSRTVDAQGNPGFITYGTKTGTDDATVVTYPYVMGKYQFHIPGVGNFLEFLKTPQGYIVCIFVPFMLLIIYQGVNCVRLFRRYKREQTAAMDAEKAQIEAERAENAKMLEELYALKAQLQGGTAAPDAAAAPVEAEAPVESTEDAAGDNASTDSAD